MFRVMQFCKANVLFFVGILYCSHAGAEDGYPNRPINVIVPYPAGGGGDILTRIVTQEMSKSLGQPMVVLNRLGAGGKVGVTAAKREKPDGYTVLISSTSTMTVFPVLEPKLAYKPLKDFVSASLIADTPGVLLATKSIAADNLKGINTLLRDHPEKYLIASGTPATFLASELYKQALGRTIQTINYNGSPPVILDLVPGRVHLTFIIVAAAMQEINNGNAKAIAVTSEKRISQLPNTGTMKEAGMGEVDASSWFGFSFPAGVESTRFL